MKKIEILSVLICFIFSTISAQSYKNSTEQNLLGLWNLSDMQKKAKAEKEYQQGLSHFSGYGAVKDSARAVECMIFAANNGSVAASRYLGKMYFFGNYVKKDYKASKKWFRKAAFLNNDSESYYYVGLMYSNEDMLGYKYKKAKRWFSWAIKFSSSQSKNAAYELGLLYLKEGKEIDEGVDCIAKAASQGQSMAQYKLGMMYLNGDYISKDKKEAKKWIKSAANSGVKEAKEVLKNNF